MTATRIPADHARDAYDAFAPHYDAFTAHHRYDSWTASLEGHARRAGLRGRRLLDVACGTGKSFLPFLDRGYAVTACDVAPEMLRIARAKAAGRARLEQLDMRRLPRLGEFDLVCLLDDAVNYLDSERELLATFRGVVTNLADDGVVVFDANTVMAYRSFFASATVVRDGDALLVWDGRASRHFAEGDACEAELLAFAPDGDGRWTLRRGVHRQRHHACARVLDVLAEAGLHWTTVLGMHPDGSYTDELDELVNSKAVYIARRCAPERERRR